MEATMNAKTSGTWKQHALPMSRLINARLLRWGHYMLPSRRLRLFSPMLLLAVACVPCGTAQARPYRGGIPWSFLLCKFSDSPNPQNDPTYYRNMTINSGTQGLQDYIKSISNGVADLSGSMLHG